MRIKKLNLSKKHLPEDMVMKPEIVKLGNVIGGLNKLLAFARSTQIFRILILKKQKTSAKSLA